MSGIGGILNVDGAPVDLELLERMRDIIAHRGPDGSGIWAKENVGFVHRLLWNSEESVHEKQPITNGRGLWITADCRIDNRDELKAEFQARDVWREMQRLFNPNPPPDSAYILSAYELWKENSPNHLLGDFAFAIWDERNQALFCSRDQIGLRLFIYFWNKKKFIFGSTTKQILQDFTVPVDLNLPHIGEVMALTFSDREETPYKSIQRLPPGHNILIKKGCLTLKRYWSWEPEQEPLSKAPVQENAENFRLLFKEAVNARFRVPPGYRVGSFLSGGLDSSSIVAMVASKPDFRPDSLPVFTLHFPEADNSLKRQTADPVDERAYVKTLVDAYGLESHMIEIAGLGPFENIKENFWLEEGPFLFPIYAFNLHGVNIARKQGVRILLRGEGGDEIFSVGSHCFLNSLKRGDLIGFLREINSKRKLHNYSYLRLLDIVFRMFVPEAIKIPYRRLFREKRLLRPWIDKNFAKKIDLLTHCERDFYNQPQYNTSGSYGLISWIKAAYNVTVLESLTRTEDSCQIETRLPYLDVRLFRFMASIPSNQKRLRWVTKFLLRESLKNLLPPKICTRLYKTEFTPVIRPALEKYGKAEIGRVLECPHKILQKIVPPKKLRLQTIKYLRSRPHRFKPSFLWPLWGAICFNEWLRQHGDFLKKIREDKNGTREKNTQCVASPAR